MDQIDQVPRSYPMPADVDVDDKIAFGCTARQLVILGTAAALLYVAYGTFGPRLGFSTFLMLAGPFAAVALALALTRRDGVSLDRWVWAGLVHLARTRRIPDPHPTTDPTTTAPAAGGFGWLGGLGGLRRPAAPVVLAPRGTGQAGHLGIADLGEHGLAALAAVSPVSFALRSPAEQHSLITVFGQWLNSLTAPVHLLVRTLPLDLSGKISELEQAADGLAHPALARAAADHAAHLARLGAEHDLLCRQVLLVFREPTPTPARGGEDKQAAVDRVALTRISQRVAEAAELLAPAGLHLTPLDADQAAAVLATACDPGPTPHDGGGAHTHPDPGPEHSAETGDEGDGSGGRGWYPLLSIGGGSA